MFARFRLLSALGVVLIAAGCRNTQVTQTGSTATEQMLLVQAWDKALEQVDFQALAGKKVYLETGNLKASNAGWLIFRVRESMCSQGVLLEAKAELADVIVEASAAVYGTDVVTTKIGVANVAGMAAPEALGNLMPAGLSSQRFDQFGAARLALFAIDSQSRQLIWQSGPLDGGSCVHVTNGPLPWNKSTGTIPTPAQTKCPRCDRISSTDGP